MSDIIARRFAINGIVQGVGFRPFVFQLAHRYGLAGDVANTSSGVSILVEGSPGAIDAFGRDITTKNPPLSRITDIVEIAEMVGNRTGFTIVASRAGRSRATLISPDVSICEDCRRELFDPGDRRFRYPFINCTNCGPRYTIIDDIPYDRPNTSMKHFPMCPDCFREYEDPMDRRFHAQPNACHVCGPHVTLFDHRQQRIEVVDAIEETRRLLMEGYIVAIKGLGGFHLAVDAENTDAVQRLRRRKHREEKPFALMAESLDIIRRYAGMSAAERRLLQSIQRPIVLLSRKNSCPISEAVAPGNRYLGFMLPYTPLHCLLLAEIEKPLVMTSGNMSEEPIAIDNNEAFERLSGIADCFLVHNRDIYLRSDDSIVRHVAGDIRFIRRSRGFIPVPVFLENSLPPILACGAGLKNTICLTRGDKAFVSQHIGDLKNVVTYDFFRQTDRHMRRILDIEPELVACDMHPDYLSSRYAAELSDLKRIEVQHHHAHIVSCMAENRIEGPVIGLSFDGTGLGTDGAIWGGEVLTATFGEFTRQAHMAYVPMPGGNAAIAEPWRMGLSYLYACYGDDLWNCALPFVHTVDSKSGRVLLDMIRKNVNCPLTSSLGRLFDGVAAILGIRSHTAFEGQAAMELEMIAGRPGREYYPWEWSRGEPRRIRFEPIIQAIVRDREEGVSPPVISARFHATMQHLFTDLCVAVRRDTGLDRVVMSGGVFQNAIMLRLLLKSLEEKGFTVYTHSLVPTNDGGISLGQAVAAQAMVR